MGKQKHGKRPPIGKRGQGVEEYTISPARWLNQSVNRLVRKGHSLRDIEHYTLSQFMMCLQATVELEAQERRNFVADMSAVVGSLFHGKGESPAQVLLNGLTRAAAGVKDGDPEE